MNASRFRSARLLAALALAPAALFAAPIVSYDFSQATTSGTTVIVPDAVAGNDLNFRMAATFVPASGAAPASVVLDGTQTEAARARRNLPAMPEIRIEMKLNPAGTGPDAQTVLQCGGSYELRYLRNRNAIEFIVQHPPTRFSVVRVPIPAGQWSDVVAVYQAGRLTFQVGTQSRSVQVPAGSAPTSIETSLRLGVQTNNGDRIFHGAIAGLTLMDP